MIKEFDILTEEERDLMMKVPYLVSILIAGADDNIDKIEIRRAVELAYSKQKNAREQLLDYYREISENYEDKMKVLIQQYPVQAEQRNPMIIEELKKLNTILPKLDSRFSVEFYASIRGIAKKVAEASGGVLGYMAVGYEEHKLMDLRMIEDPAV